MKWFKVESSFGNHPTIQRLLNHPELGTSALGSLILLWAFTATYGRDELHPGRCVDGQGHPIAKQDLVIAARMTDAQFDALIALLQQTGSIDIDAWTTRQELSFPGLTRRADPYTDKVRKRRERDLKASGLQRGDMAPQMVPAQRTATPAPSLLPPSPEYALVSRVAPTTPRFEGFWKLYPRKQNKKKALAVWQSKAFRVEHNTQLYEAIMAGLTRQVASWEARGTDVAHICHGDQFLKHRRWEDEPLPVTSKDTSVSDLHASRERFRARQSAGMKGEQ